MPGFGVAVRGGADAPGVATAAGAGVVGSAVGVLVPVPANGTSACAFASFLSSFCYVNMYKEEHERGQLLSGDSMGRREDGPASSCLLELVATLLRVR